MDEKMVKDIETAEEGFVIEDLDERALASNQPSPSAFFSELPTE